MENVGLVDTLDHLLNRGVVLVGESTISLADVELVYIGLNLVLSSVETLKHHGGTAEAGASLAGPRPGQGRPGALGEVEDYRRDASRGRGVLPTLAKSTLPLRRPAEAGDTVGQRPERGLAQVVLTLVELLRQLMERQAVRRMAGGSIPEEKVEEMGLALMELEARMAELRDIFGLEERDLQLDLGPLGRLL